MANVLTDHQLTHLMTGIIDNKRLGTGGWAPVVTTHGGDGGVISSARCSCLGQLSYQFGSLIPSHHDMDQHENKYVCLFVCGDQG